MKCSEVVKILECTSFTDNNFSDLDKNEELDNHINNCEECEAKRDKIREYDLLLKARIKNVKTVEYFMGVKWNTSSIRDASSFDISFPIRIRDSK